MAISPDGSYLYAALEGATVADPDQRRRFVYEFSIDDKVNDVATDVEDAGALRPEQPFVSVSRQEVDRRLLDVERQHTDSLDGIDEEVHAALVAELHHEVPPRLYRYRRADRRALPDVQ